jgi:hypothetical protein
MADVDIMRGLTALDDQLREHSPGAGPPGAGLFEFLQQLAVSRMGLPRHAFPAEPAGDARAHPADPTAGPVPTPKATPASTATRRHE